MTIAELHGKLAARDDASGYEYSEDLLTADVFGAMRYAGWEWGFLDWLLHAECAPVSPLPPPIADVLRPADLQEVEYGFWPTLTNGREPDLALLLRYDSGPALLIVVEAKYLSGMSDWEGNAPDDEDTLTGVQILDQVRGMTRMSPEELLAWFEEDGGSPNEPTELLRIHLLVTAHVTLPLDVYRRAVKKTDRRWPPCYWLSWTTLAECIEPYLEQAQGGQRALLSDLYALLYRKELVCFRGFGRATWQSKGVEPSFWAERWWRQKSWPGSYASLAFWRKHWWCTQPWVGGSTETFWRG